MTFNWKILRLFALVAGGTWLGSTALGALIGSVPAALLGLVAVVGGWLLLEQREQERKDQAREDPCVTNDTRILLKALHEIYSNDPPNAAEIAGNALARWVSTMPNGEFEPHLVITTLDKHNPKVVDNHE